MGVCAGCGEDVDDADAHFPHEEGCGFEEGVLCRCDVVACPVCCPSCNRELRDGLVKDLVKSRFTGLEPDEETGW